MRKLFDGYLLVSDMDETLLNNESRISKENLDAIRYFVSNGGEFILATGRMVPSAKRFVDEIGVITLPVILYNGAKVYDYTNEQTVFEYFIEDERKNLINVLKNNISDVGIEIYCDEAVYVVQRCELSNRFSKDKYPVIFDIEDDIWSKKWTKIMLAGDSSRIDEIESEFSEKYDDGLIMRSGKSYLEIIPNGITKATSLERLAKIYEVNIEKIIAIGDNMNDLDMIDFAKYGFTVKNATPRVLEKAKKITPTNNDNAIAYVVKWMEDNILV